MTRYYPKWEVYVRMRAIENNSHVAGMQVVCHSCGIILHSCNDDCLRLSRVEGLSLEAVPEAGSYVVMDCHTDTSGTQTNCLQAPNLNTAVQRTAKINEGSQLLLSTLKRKKRGCRGGGKKMKARAGRVSTIDQRIFYSPQLLLPVCIPCAQNKLHINVSKGLKCRSPVHPKFLHEYSYLKSLLTKYVPCKYGMKCSIASCQYEHPPLQSCYINSLNDDLLKTILAFCGDKDLLQNVGSVCVRWRDVAKDVYVKRPRMAGDNPILFSSGGPHYKPTWHQTKFTTYTRNNLFSFHQEEIQLKKLMCRLDQALACRGSIWDLMSAADADPDTPPVKKMNLLVKERAVMDEIDTDTVWRTYFDTFVASCW